MYNPEPRHATFNDLWFKHGDENQDETQCRVWFLHAWALQDQKIKELEAKLSSKQKEINAMIDCAGRDEQRNLERNKKLVIATTALEEIGYCSTENGCVSGEQCSCDVEAAEKALEQIKQ